MKEMTLVNKCEVNDCHFNSNNQCNAGQIEIQMLNQKAECATFAPTQDKASATVNKEL